MQKEVCRQVLQHCLSSEEKERVVVHSRTRLVGLGPKRVLLRDVRREERLKAQSEVNAFQKIGHW